MEQLAKKDLIVSKTARSLLLVNLLDEPLMSMQNFIPFLLTKSLGVSNFWITLLITFKPSVSLLSFFWTRKISKDTQSLKKYLIRSSLYARLPFFLLFWIPHPLYLIFCTVNFFLFYRAANPAWMEILKLNLPTQERQKFYSLGWVLGYIEAVLLAFALGSLLDWYPAIWQNLFLIGTTISSSILILYALLPIEPKSIEQEEKGSFTGLKTTCLSAFALLKKRYDFFLFQLGFMSAGFGVMMLQPVLPIFSHATLKLSYLEFAFATIVLKGIALTCSAWLWAKFLHAKNLLHLSLLVCLGFGLFAYLILFSETSLFFYYFAYFIYGLAYSGSHLIWNLSGPLFSSEESSTNYSSINVLMVGARGLIAPVIGSALMRALGISWTVLTAGSLCMVGAIILGLGILSLQNQVNQNSTNKA